VVWWGPKKCGPKQNSVLVLISALVMPREP
jgi:hypothetical protein